MFAAERLVADRLNDPFREISVYLVLVLEEEAEFREHGEVVRRACEKVVPRVRADALRAVRGRGAEQLGSPFDDLNALAKRRGCERPGGNHEKVARLAPDGGLQRREFSCALKVG